MEIGLHEKLSDIFSALGSPVRLKILSILSGTKRPLHIKAVSKQLGIDYTTAYRHISTLKRAGLLDIYEVGRSRVLSISRPKELKALLDAAQAISAGDA